jgi:hypothetical protein
MKLGRGNSAVLAIAISATAVLSAGTAVAGHDRFTDGPFGSHAAGVEFVGDAGITTGCTATTYCPTQSVSRAQMATFLHRLSGNAPGVPPSVDAARLGGASLDDLTYWTWPVLEDFAGGLGLAACPEGGQALSGMFDLASGSVFTNVASFPVYDDVSGQEGWLVAFADPATGALAGSGEVGVQCLLTAGTFSAASAQPSELSRERLMELYEAGPSARPRG